MTRNEELLNDTKLANFVGLSYSKEDLTAAKALIAAPFPEQKAFVDGRAKALWWVPAGIGAVGLVWVGGASYFTRRRRR